MAAGGNGKQRNTAPTQCRLRGDTFPKDCRRGVEGFLNHVEVQQFKQALQARTAKEGIDELERLANRLADLGSEVEAHASKGNWRRGVLAVVARATFSLAAVVSAAIGGTVISSGALPAWGRYAIAAAAFASAALSALNIAGDFSADLRRHLLYDSLQRRVRHYILVRLTRGSPEAAATALDRFTAEYCAIRRLQALPRTQTGPADEEARAADAESRADQR